MTSVGTRFVELHLDEQIKLLQYCIGEAESEKVIPEEVKSKEEVEKVASEEVKSKEEAEKVELKDLSWFADQMNQAVKSEGVVQATAPRGGGERERGQ